MFFDIAHTTTYQFSRPVFLEPHIFRLRPRCDASQRLRDFQLLIEPEPAGFSEYLDPEGNCVAHAWFVGVGDSLVVTARSRVETLRGNPFDYILGHPSLDRLPMTYPGELDSLLALYRVRDDADASVAAFAASVADEAEGRPLPFLDTLNRRIFQRCQVMTREEGGPLSPRVTLAERGGACRDLAVLFVDACRAFGFGARFVSGYQQGDPDTQKRDLHAWAEVYVPGGGWRGYDPTYGLSVADRHVAVAAGMRPEGAAPVTGTFRGTGVSSQMQADIRIIASSGGERSACWGAPRASTGSPRQTAAKESAVGHEPDATIVVRDAVPGDAVALALIYNQGIADRLATLETEERTADERRAWLEARGPRHPVIVAEADDRMVGFGSLNVFNPRKAYKHVADFSLYVERGWRGKGVGRILLAALIDRARRIGYHKMVLSAFPFNQAGMALYEKLGFRVVGVYKEQGLLDGRWVDTIIMEKILDETP